MAAALKDYAVDLCAETRRNAAVALGASPRATLTLIGLAQAVAAMADRDYVLPDDIKLLVPWVLPHRIVLTAAARWRQLTPEAVVRSTLRSVQVPTAVAARR